MRIKCVHYKLTNKKVVGDNYLSTITLHRIIINKLKNIYI